MTTQRIAKAIASAGVCSRREAEKLIAQGVVTVAGKVIDSPALNVTSQDIITVSGKQINRNEPTHLWLYHKPKGLVTTHRDEKNRPTVFQELPKTLPRVVSVGRLDLNSEGLLLLTNNGELAGKIAHPSTGWKRCYRVRVHGRPQEKELDMLRKGAKIDGMQYAPASITLKETMSANCWLEVTLTEGKNREIRRMFEHINCPVNRLIRTSFGQFKLGSLKPSQTLKIDDAVVEKLIPELQL